jgi:hypothetical protein
MPTYMRYYSLILGDNYRLNVYSCLATTPPMAVQPHDARRRGYVEKLCGCVMRFSPREGLANSNYT